MQVKAQQYVPLKQILIMAKSVLANVAKRVANGEKFNRDLLASEIIHSIINNKEYKLTENHVRTLVNILNNLIYFKIIKATNTTAAFFEPVSMDFLTDRLSAYIRKIKDEKMKRIQNPKSSNDGAEHKSAAEAELPSEATIEDYIIVVPRTNVVRVDTAEPKVDIYRVLKEVAHELGLDINFNQSDKPIRYDTNQALIHMNMQLEEILSKLNNNGIKLEGLVDVFANQLRNIVLGGINDSGIGNLDTIYTLIHRDFPQIERMEATEIKIPYDLSNAENELIYFNKFWEYVINNMKSQKILPEGYSFDFVPVDLTGIYATLNENHPLFKSVEAYLNLVTERLWLIMEAKKKIREINNLKRAISLTWGGYQYV